MHILKVFSLAYIYVCKHIYIHTYICISLSSSHLPQSMYKQDCGASIPGSGYIDPGISRTTYPGISIRVYPGSHTRIRDIPGSIYPDPGYTRILVLPGMREFIHTYTRLCACVLAHMCLVPPLLLHMHTCV